MISKMISATSRWTYKCREYAASLTTVVLVPRGHMSYKQLEGAASQWELNTHPQHACLLWVLSKIATLRVEIRFFGYHGFN